jgi:hypothetical protein
MANLFTALRTILLALIVATASLPAAAGDLDEFAEAVERLFREAWHDVITRLDNHRPAEFEGDESYAVTMTEVDAALVGVLIVIDIGTRESARAALAPIGERLAKLRERVERR